MPKRYVYKKKIFVVLVTVFDFIGYVACKTIKLFVLPRADELEVKKILILKLDHAGDVLLSTPAIRAIRNAFPQAYITLVVSPWSADIVKRNQDVDEVIPYKAYWHNRSPEKRINLKETYNLIKYLRKQKYDLAFDLRGDIFAIIISVLAGAPKRVGYGWEGGGFLLTNEVKTSVDKYQVEILLDALRTIGIEPSGELSPEIIISKKDKIAASEFLGDCGRVLETPLVGFHIGAGYPSKLWEPTRYAELMNIIAEKYNSQILIVGGCEDKIIYEGIEKNLNFNPINVIGKTNFLETAALIKQCNLFIGNDSAPVHIAAAVGTPTIVIFSAANKSRRWAPKGKQVLVIKKDVPCGGCEKHECEDIQCMQSITVDEVFEAVDSYFLRKKSL